MAKFESAHDLEVGDTVYFTDEDGRDRWGNVAQIITAADLLVDMEGIHGVVVKISKITRAFR